MSRAPSPHGVDSSVEHRSQSADGVLRHHEQLDAELARVAGSVDHRRDAVDLASANVNAGAGLEAEPLERARTLDGDQRVVVRHITNVGSPALAPLIHAKSAAVFAAFTTAGTGTGSSS